MGKYADLISNYALYGENGYYVEPFIIHMMIVDELKLPMSFNEIKTFIKECNISITADEIKEFLDKKMVEEEPGLKEKIEKEMKTSSIITFTGDEGEDKRRIDASVEKMKDMATASKYYFEPYSLKYFKTYVSILKKKCSALFDVLADLDKIKTEEITEEGRQRILDLDFHINEEGNVYVEDINRFAEALVYIM